MLQSAHRLGRRRGRALIQARRLRTRLTFAGEPPPGLAKWLPVIRARATPRSERARLRR